MIRDPAEPLTVGPWLRRLSREHGDRVAVARGHDRLTYSAFDTRSSALGAALAESGVSKGARVGILLPNGPAWIVAFAAVTRIGAAAVPISTLATALGGRGSCG